MASTLISGPDVSNWTTVQPADRVLPVQPVLKELYRETEDDYFSRLLKMCTFSATGFDLLDRFDIELPRGFSYSQLGSDAVTLNLMRFMVQLCGCKKGLEIGTFIGASAMLIADAMPSQGTVVTVEKFSEFAAVAQRNVRNNDFGDRIEILQGDALELQDEIATRGPFDFIYLDGDKGNYDKLLPRLAPLATGLIMVDDVLFHGDVLNDVPISTKGQGVRQMLTYVDECDAFIKTLLPIRNGVLLLKKS